MKERDSVIFYRSFYEAIRELPDEIQSKVYSAIFEYSLNFTELPLEGLAKTVFILIKPQLDANNARFINGAKGGRKKQFQTGEKPNENQNKTEAEPNVNVNVNVNENVKENIGGEGGDLISDKKTTEAKKPKPTPVKQTPTLDEVVRYFTENGYSATGAKTAWEYYEAGDWKDSKGKPVRNWKQKMRGVWFRDEYRTKNTAPAVQWEAELQGKFSDKKWQ